MNLEELRKLNLSNNLLSDDIKAETLTKTLNITNSDFQQHLTLMKLHNKPTKEKRLSSTTPNYKINGQFARLFESGNNETNYTYYIKFINNILTNINRGEIEYCYYIGQVRELLRFIPDLKVNLCDFYFEVSSDSYLIEKQNKAINKIVKKCLLHHEGGIKFFNMLDENIRKDKNLFYHMINFINTFKIDYQGIIVSGKFGKEFFKYVKEQNYFKDKHIICVNGGLRVVKPVVNLCNIDIKLLNNKNFILIDDSFYSGKTRNVIKDTLNIYESELLHTFVFYDGSITKEVNVSGFYRWYK